jgi:hypothetical protein
VTITPPPVIEPRTPEPPAQLRAPLLLKPHITIRPPQEITALWVAVILLGHGLYGIVLVRSAAFATLHAMVTFGVALWAAMTSSMRRVAIVCAYMAGSEILWRIGKATLPWEFVKYATVLMMVITLARIRRLRWDWTAVSYFALLLPSTFLSFSEQPFEFARQQVSFNLSGPLLLAVSTWFFTQLKPGRPDVQRLFLAIMAPVVSLGLIAMTKTASLEDLTFTDASNFQTSAGYGPNQVSTMLGLGVLLAILLSLLVEHRAKERFVYTGFALWLGTMSALTFSRGGLFGALGALLVAAPLLMKGARNRLALLVGAMVVVGAVQIIVIPKLDALTGGAIITRFQDTDPTGRDVLIKSELETFTKNPIFGTGPATLDEFEEHSSSSHTEFSRLLSQHGIFGVGALALMLVLALRAVTSQTSTSAKAIAIALVAWSMLTMTHAAMRLAMTPLAFGMAAALYFATRPPSHQAPAAESRA